MTYMTVERRGDRFVPTRPTDTLSVGQLASMLGWSLRTTYTHLRGNRIPARQVGTRWVISRRRIEEWLNGEDA